MKYSFDPTKDAAKLVKHGVSLADGEGVLSDPLARTIEDARSEGEPRWVTMGTNSLGDLMVVGWAPRGEGIRIISVRRAEPVERRSYEKDI